VTPGAVLTFAYRDTRAGRATISASAPGTTQATRDVTVVAGPTARVSVAPASREIRARGEATFRAAATDTFGNPASAVTWSVLPATAGKLVRARPDSVVFQAGRVLGNAVVTATTKGGTVSGSASVVVRPGTLRIGSVVFRQTAPGVEATVKAIDGARRPISRAKLRLVVQRDGRRVAGARVVTGPAGKGRVLAPAGAGCYTVFVTHATAQGFTWNGKSPRNRFCRP